MKVRISQSIDFEDVPSESIEITEEAVEILQKSLVKLYLMKGKLKANPEGLEIKDEMLETLTEVRTLLSDADHKVSDNLMILSGYFNALEEMNQQTEEVPEVEVKVESKEGENVVK